MAANKTGKSTVTGMWLVAFWLLQTLADVLFKWGTTAKGRGAWGYWLGNLSITASTWPLMQLYRYLNPNYAFTLGIGGAFLCAQAGLALAFATRPSALNWAGYLVVAAGMALASFNGPDDANLDDATPDDEAKVEA